MNEYIRIRELPTGKGFADIVYVPKINSDKPAMIIELKYDNMGAFKEGVAWISLDSKSRDENEEGIGFISLNSKFGYVNKEGIEVICQLNTLKVNSIASNIAQKLVDSFPEQNFNYRR